MSSSALARLATVFLFTAVAAGTWDAWWHGAIGRESFWEPPHILLYSTIIGAIVSGVYGWRIFQEAVWKRLALTLLLILVAAPFDDIWHRIFGVESLTSPLIVWSPPHLVLIGSLIGSFTFLLPLLQKEKDASARRLFGAMAFAGILSLLLFVLVPFEPTGPFALFGFPGAGLGSLAMVLTYLFGRRWIGGFGATFTLALVLLALTAIEFGETSTTGAAVIPHDHPPAWLTAFSILLPAVFLDLRLRLPIPVQGGLAGLLSCGLIYGFSSMFFTPEFQYGWQDSVVAIISGVVGGIVAGTAFRRVIPSP